MLKINYMKASASALALFAVVPAFAQDTKDPLLLERILIEAPKQAVSSSTDVIEGETLLIENGSGTQGLFRDIPGVNGGGAPGGGLTDINIRGLDGVGNVIVTIDGAEKNSSTSRHGVEFAPVYFDPALLKSVSVTKGPGSWKDGIGANGGRVTFETVDPSDVIESGETRGHRLSFGGQSNASGPNGSFASAFQISPSSSILLGLSGNDYDDYEDGDGEEVRSQGDSHTALVKYVFSPDENLNIELSYIGTRKNFDSSALFGGATIVGSDIEQEAQDDSLSLSFERRTASAWILGGRIAYSRTDEEEQQAGSRRNPAGSLRERLNETTNVALHATRSFDLGGHSHETTFGLNYTTSDNELEENGVRDGDGSGTRDVGNIYVEDVFSPNERWTLYSGLAYQFYDTENDSLSDSGGILLPKFAAEFQANENWLFFGSASLTNRSPRFDELSEDRFAPAGRRSAARVTYANGDLEGETSLNLEIGAKFEKADVFRDGDSLSLGATLYRKNLRNRIEEVSLGTTIDVGGITYEEYELRNTDAFIQGLELAANYDAGRYFLSAVVDLQDGEHTNGEFDGNTLSSVRPENGILRGGMRFMEQRLTVGGEVEIWSSKTDEPDSRNNSAGSSSVVGSGMTDSYEVFNLFASYAINDSWNITGRINNVSDETYRRFDSAENAPGRNVVVSVSTRF